jgi:hypothetical protein
MAADERQESVARLCECRESLERLKRSREPATVAFAGSELFEGS